jgi:hypothetical protein
MPGFGNLGQYETALDGEMEAIVDIMEFVDQTEIRGDLTIHSDAQAAIARVSHNGTGPGQDIFEITSSYLGQLEPLVSSEYSDYTSKSLTHGTSVGFLLSAKIE